LIVSLFSDGFTNAIQSIMQSRDIKPTADELMLYMNTFATMFVGAALLVSQQAGPAIIFCMEYPEVNWDILIFTACMAIGQIFIFWCIAAYGPLVCSIVTTTRKFFTILFSVFWYGHEMGLWEWFGVFLVFVGLMYEVLTEVKKSKDSSNKHVRKGE
jgi:UDP-galactose transporter B1